MAGEIDRLINQVYTTQLKENEAAIKALQMQINPHFLYNTLDMIKSMAETLRGVSGIRGNCRPYRACSVCLPTAWI